MTESKNGVVVKHEPKHVYRLGDATVRANTKSEARAKFKKIMGRNPAGTKLEKMA